MERPVCYDVTRLLTRVSNATPNGIDRIDLALARHFLDAANENTFGAVSTPFGMRLLEGAAAAEAIQAIADHWREEETDPSGNAAFRRVVAFLGGGRDEAWAPQEAKRRSRFSISPQGATAWIKRHGLPMMRKPHRDLPAGSVYVNVSQFPLWLASPFAWLERRADMRGVFFIHDLLPISLPEYFRSGEYARHRKRLQVFARFGAAAVVTTQSVAQELEAHLAGLGRRNCPIFVAPTPVAPIFGTPRAIDPALSDTPYFVVCSTLEPRKNHLMLLAVWRALVERRGRSAPKLLLVGARGWHYAPIVDLLRRSPALGDHVMEVRGLSTPALKRLIDNARGLLMPSFGEGYGLPVREALTAGAPVIASDIPAFREIEAEGLNRLSPLAGDAWLAAIEAMTERPRLVEAGSISAIDDATYFARLDRFLDQL